MYTQMMDTRKEMKEGSRDRRIPDDPVTALLTSGSARVVLASV
jgi:hypothetical protein